MASKDLIFQPSVSDINPTYKTIAGVSDTHEDLSTAKAVKQVGGLAKDIYGGVVEAGVEVDVTGLERQAAEDYFGRGRIEAEQSALAARAARLDSSEPELKDIQTRLHALDRAKSRGMSPSEAGTRREALIKEGINKAPWLKNQIIASGKSEIISKLYSAEIEIQKNIRERDIKAIQEMGLDPTNPESRVALQMHRQNEAEAKYVSSQNITQEAKANRIGKIFVDNQNIIINSMVRRFGNDIDKLGIDSKTQLAQQLQMYRANIEYNVSQHLEQQGLINVDPKTIKAYADILNRKIDDIQKVVSGEKPKEILDNTLSRKQRQVLIDIDEKDHVLFSAMASMKYVGSTISGRTEFDKAGTRYSLYMENLGKSLLNEQEGKGEVQDRGTLSSLEGDMDSKEARKTQKDTNEALVEGTKGTLAHPKLSPEEKTKAVDLYSKQLERISKAMTTGAITEYSAASIEPYINAALAPNTPILNNIKTHTKSNVIFNNYQKVIGSYIQDKIVGDGRDSGEITGALSSTYTVGDKSVTLGQLVKVETNPRGGITFELDATKINTLLPKDRKTVLDINIYDSSVARISRDIQNLNKNVSHRTANAIQALLNVRTELGFKESSEVLYRTLVGDRIEKMLLPLEKIKVPQSNVIVEQETEISRAIKGTVERFSEEPKAEGTKLSAKLESKIKDFEVIGKEYKLEDTAEVAKAYREGKKITLLYNDTDDNSFMQAVDKAIKNKKLIGNVVSIE